jgi:hypothetical protein
VSGWASIRRAAASRRPREIGAPKMKTLAISGEKLPAYDCASTSGPLENQDGELKITTFLPFRARPNAPNVCRKRRLLIPGLPTEKASKPVGSDRKSCAALYGLPQQ